MSQTTTLLDVQHLSMGFISGQGFLTALEDVSFSVEQGKTFALLGESGCGKSLTSLSIMQLLPLNAEISANSRICFKKTDLLTLPEARMRTYRGKRIAMIFQEPMTSLNPVLTVGQQISEVLHCHLKLRGAECQQRVLSLLDAVGIPAAKTRINEYPHQLSGGMKQRIMIAMALAGEPDLLIADEPTTALDVTIQAQVLNLLNDLQQQTNMAMLLITHDLSVVATMANDVAVMYAGQIVEQASCDDFFRNPQHPYSKKLFSAVPDLKKRDSSLAVIKGMVPSLAQRGDSCRFANRCEHVFDLCHQHNPELTALDNHRLVRCHLYHQQQPITVTHHHQQQPEATRHPQVTSDPILKINDLKVHFPIYRGLLKREVASVKAVDGIDLQLFPGKTLALVGESGCGKTTIGKSILQLIKASSGCIMLKGEDLTQLSQTQMRKQRHQLQIIFQDPFSAMNPRMMVADIIAEGIDALGLEQDKQKISQRIDEILQQVGLPAASKTRYPHEFSGGQRQRICIARALAVRPDVIICDEPTSALDVSVQAQILNLLKSLQQTLGISYLFITHNISVVAYLADEVAVMYLGRIVEQGPVKDILTKPQHPYTQALLGAVLSIDNKEQNILKVAGELPSPIAPPAGCHFHPRCKQAIDACRQAYPQARYFTEEHMVKCHLLEEHE